MQVFIVQKNQAGQRLDKFLPKYLPEAPMSFFYKMLRKKNITLNGKKAEGKEILNVNDEIKFFLSDETFEKFKGGNEGNKQTKNSINTSEYETAYITLKGITVIYEDENVLILNKPAGILTQKAEGDSLSLNEWMIGYLLKEGKTSGEELSLFKPSVCNRLDRNTSGLVLCGISLLGSQTLSAMMKNRDMGKFYRTICLGKVEGKQVLEGSLSKDHKTNKVTVGKQEEDYIKTIFEPIKGLKNNLTYIEVELITGKTHQIRAHLASVKHPLIGDAKYGDQGINKNFFEKYRLRHQLLHAYRIVFPERMDKLPELSGKEFIAPLPKIFVNILEEQN